MKKNATKKWAGMFQKVQKAAKNKGKDLIAIKTTVKRVFNNGKTKTKTTVKKYGSDDLAKAKKKVTKWTKKVIGKNNANSGSKNKAEKFKNFFKNKSWGGIKF